MLKSEIEEAFEAATELEKLELMHVAMRNKYVKVDAIYEYFFEQKLSKADPDLLDESFEGTNFAFTKYLRGNGKLKQKTIELILDNPGFYVKSIAFLSFMM